LDGLGGVVALHFDLVLSVLMCEMVCQFQSLRGCAVTS
jgi:hypothetical protein